MHNGRTHCSQRADNGQDARRPNAADFDIVHHAVQYGLCILYNIEYYSTNRVAAGTLSSTRTEGLIDLLYITKL